MLAKHDDRGGNANRLENRIREIVPKLEVKIGVVQAQLLNMQNPTVHPNHISRAGVDARRRGEKEWVTFGRAVNDIIAVREDQGMRRWLALRHRWSRRNVE
jgi:hypothetical protein